MPIQYKPIPNLTPQQIIEFKSKTKIKGKCLIWIGCTIEEYGIMTVNGQNYIASRIAFKLANGYCPIDKLICHHCDNPPCVTPLHLFAGTHKDNGLDASDKGRLIKGDNHWMRLHPERTRKGEVHPLAKLTNEDIVLLKKLISFGNSDKIIYEFFKGRISRSHIGGIRRGTFWKHITI